MKRILLLLSLCPLLAGGESHLVDAVYTLDIRDIPAGARIVKAWIPMPRTDDRQVLLEYLVRGGPPATVFTDPATGNRVLGVDLASPSGGGDVFLTVLFRVERFEAPHSPPPAEPDAPRPFPARLVISDPRVREPAPVDDAGREAVRAAILRLTGPEGAASTRGLSDSDRARALHVRLVRELGEAGIPARLVSGLVLPRDRAPWAGAGPRVWAEYRLSGQTWEPVDLAADPGGEVGDRIVLEARPAPDPIRDRSGEPEWPLVKIDGMVHHALDGAWSGRESARDPVRLAHYSRGPGERY